MKPIVKYQGGKSRELPLIKELLPNKFERIVEPFAGGAAVSFGLEIPALLTDINTEVINVYNVVASELYPELQHRIDIIKKMPYEELQPLYYDSREIINDPNSYNSFDRAVAYIIVRQLCFSGMERYNSAGKFNVPFGHYKKFACNLSVSHHEYLTRCPQAAVVSFEDTFTQIRKDDFVFIDPPYLERLGYQDADGGLPLHDTLYHLLTNLGDIPWMIIHSDHEFYREMYKNYNILTKDFLYGQRFGKNKNHANANVQHLYITNYSV